MAPHSMARPQRFSSIEYSFSLVTESGISHFAAYSMQSSPSQPPHPGRREDLEVGCERPGPHLEADLVVALARAPVGDRVGAVATGLGDQVRARSPAGRARTRAGTCPRTARWPAAPGTQNSSAISSRASMTIASTAPAARARARIASQSSPPARGLPDVDGHRDHLGARSPPSANARRPRCRDHRCRPARLAASIIVPLPRAVSAWVAGNGPVRRCPAQAVEAGHAPRGGRPPPRLRASPTRPRAPCRRRPPSR